MSRARLPGTFWNNVAAFLVPAVACAVTELGRKTVAQKYWSFTLLGDGRLGFEDSPTPSHRNLEFA